MSPISRFEKFARDLVEGSFDRLLRQPGPMTEVASGLASAAEGSQQNGLTANHYVVKIHPATLGELQTQSANYESLMEEMLIRLGEQNTLVFAGDVRVEFVADTSVEKGRSTIVADRSKLQDEPTAVLLRKKGSTAPLAMAEAYLIINGRRHVNLDRPVNSIGRSLENDIVLEEQGVSRTHAQIRWRNGRFEIFDLGSRAGTLVNGQHLTRSALKSGDVITIGTVALIYGEEDRVEGSSGTDGRVSVDITQELSSDDMI